MTRTGSLDHLVGEADTAPVLGSGDVPVLGTPRVLALLEAASLVALEGALGPGETSVGAELSLRHLAPSRVGELVNARAELLGREGSRLYFAVRLTQAGGDSSGRCWPRAG